MKSNGNLKTVAETVAAIFALDLEPIKFKLMSKEDGYGWTQEQADHYEMEYRRFLALTVKFPEETISPSVSVDKFWHAHILDTMKYVEDCEKVFGYFLHHYPYFGMRGEEDAANLVKAAATTRRLYIQEFGGDAVMQQTAYCAKVAGTENQTAYCAAVAGQESQAAYCAAVSGKQSQAAYCAAVAGKKEERAAYCAIAA